MFDLENLYHDLKVLCNSVLLEPSNCAFAMRFVVGLQDHRVIHYTTDPRVRIYELFLLINQIHTFVFLSFFLFIHAFLI